VHLSLETLVPAGHFSRALEAKLNLRFVRDLVRESYKQGGRPSIDPLVFFRLQLVMFFEACALSGSSCAWLQIASAFAGIAGTT
jgi:hypothetical protein